MKALFCPILFVWSILVVLTVGAKGQDKVSPSLLWDMEELREVPLFTNLDSTSSIRSMLFRSVSYEGKNTEVFAYYSDPDIVRGVKSHRKYPAVVLVHGGGGKAYREWVEQWAAEGYAAIAMDLSGNGPDGSKLPNPGPDQVDFNKFDKIAGHSLHDVWQYHAVASVILAHSWLLNQPNVDSKNSFITGISWGGYLTCIAASIDQRFKAAVPVYGCGFYAQSGVFKNDLNRLKTEDKAKWIKYFDPSSYLQQAKIPFLFINGSTDRHFNVIPYHQTYSLVADDKRFVNIVPDMKHSHSAGWLLHEPRAFFDHYAHGYGQVPRLGSVEDGDSQISALYDSPVSLYSAEFFYSSDTSSTNQHRVWSSVRAKYDPMSRKIFCPTPHEGFKYGFFFMRDHRNLSASSVFILR
ncbi:alpha/beta fold hydrolase [Sphingobacterium sp. SGG-5]|uniref:alpha/beta hydrolase family protein n=1 Tax=Sphingobacterium sp. SGG-5 TaxID=2710881 RepID=UPI0013EB88ED|nr:alpha/beta fold hydrolase [Sphingobacterium sp. SGG-5]NGM60920.1 alpha/beta fold hydrolase [Sphingobacterium sp. SGG-5]